MWPSALGQTCCILESCRVYIFDLCPLIRLLLRQNGVTSVPPYPRRVRGPSLQNCQMPLARILCMCVYGCACMCVFCACVRVCVYIYICVCVCVCVYVCVCVCVPTRVVGQHLSPGDAIKMEENVGGKRRGKENCHETSTTTFECIFFVRI